MTGDSLTPEQPPSGPLYARQSDETPRVGTRRGEGGATGPQAGAESLDPRLRAYAAVFAYIQQLPAEITYLDPATRNAVIWRAVHAALDATNPEPEQSVPAALRDRYATALRRELTRYARTDIDPGTGSDVGDQVAIVMAVRDRELEQLRIELAIQKGISADLRVESRARGEKVERVRAVVRAELDYLCREPHPSHVHVCPDDVRRSVLRALESEGQS